MYDKILYPSTGHNLVWIVALFYKLCTVPVWKGGFSISCINKLGISMGVINDFSDTDENLKPFNEQFHTFEHCNDM